MTPARPLLYVTPVVPSRTGNGLAMRSRTVLELLARRFDVSLLVVPLHGPVDPHPLAEIAALCADVEVVAAGRGSNAGSAFLSALTMRWPDVDRGGAGDLAGLPFGGRSFDVVHAYRLTALPYAVPYLSARTRPPAWHLDLDEVESATRRRLAALYRRTGREAAARFAVLEATRCRVLEREILERFDRVYVSSPAEIAALPAAAGHRARVSVVPNVVAEAGPIAGGRRHDRFRFLFVGTLGFSVNEDAVLHLCGDILPHLRRVAPRPFEVTIVGPGATSRLDAHAHESDVRLVGAVPDVAPWYRSADVVVVPLRAGGGTRLKVLEAMSYGRPVVSTSLGVEGLDVESGRHALLADTPECFAGHCGRLMMHPELGEQLARHGLELVRSAHSRQAAAAALFG